MGGAGAGAEIRGCSRVRCVEVSIYSLVALLPAGMRTSRECIQSLTRTIGPRKPRTLMPPTTSLIAPTILVLPLQISRSCSGVLRVEGSRTSCCKKHV